MWQLTQTELFCRVLVVIVSIGTAVASFWFCGAAFGGLVTIGLIISILAWWQR